MKNTIEFTSKSSSEHIIIAMKKGFPWWVLLFLLPLLLLIPIKRDFLFQLIDGAQIPVTQTSMKADFNHVGIFGSRTPDTQQPTSNDEGKFAVSDVSEPLWYYLFVDSDSVYLTGGNGCASLNHQGFKYAQFSRGKHKQVELSQTLLSSTFTVVNKKTGEPLPEATVTVEIIKNGQTDTLSFTSDANGKVSLQNIPSCYPIKVVGNKEGFNPDAKDIAAGQLEATPDSEKILRLQPQVPLMGKSGDLRINLQWTCKADLDLMVIDPCNNSISFSNKKGNCNGNIGELDIDANFKGTLRDDPQENIFWKKASPGKYYVLVVGWQHDNRTIDYEFPIEFNLSVIKGDYRIDIPGSYPREKLQKNNMAQDLELFKVYEFEVPEEEQ